MTSPERSELESRAAALRRIVYGTPDGYLGDAASELAAVEAQLGRDLPATGALPATVARPSAGGSKAVEAAAPIEQSVLGEPVEPDERVERVARVERVEPDAETSGARRGTRRGVLILVAVAAAIGLIAALGWLRELSEPPVGLAIFDRAPDPSQALIPGIDDLLTPEALASVRYLGTEVGYRAWVFRDRGDVCMTLQRENWAGSGTTCVAESDFARSGIRQVVRYEQLSDRLRPAGVGLGDGVELAWTADSTGLEWSVRR